MTQNLTKPNSELRCGFRDDQQRLTLTTDYDDATLKIEDNEADATDIIGSFVIAIPVDEVVAASLYLPEIHAKYFPHRLEHCPDPFLD